MEYDELLNNISKETGLLPLEIDRTYKAYWRFIRDIIQELPLKEVSTEEDFQKLRTNFNIPSLGKLSCTYNRVKGVRTKFNYIKKLREKL